MVLPFISTEIKKRSSIRYADNADLVTCSKEERATWSNLPSLEDNAPILAINIDGAECTKHKGIFPKQN